MKGIAVFQNKASGYILFVQHKDHVAVNVHLQGLSDGKHGFHIHKYGNLLKTDCSKCGGHYNPSGVSHGGRSSGHAGDLGNLVFRNGKSNTRFTVAKFKLEDVFGRSVVIHELEDDLGKGPNAESRKTGNSGARIASAVIGRC